MANIVYIGISLDGYIATKEGGLDWLHEVPNPTGSDYGFSDFLKRVDAIIMGRNTYEMVLSFEGKWPYSKKVFVLSNTLKAVDPSVSSKAEVINGGVIDITKALNEKGYKNVYIDGGAVIQSFLKENLIDELILTRIPIILGAGIPLFSNDGNVFRLQHVETKVFDNALVKSHYKRR